MFTTVRLANDLAAMMVPIGLVGAGIAIVCAIVAGFAIACGAGGLSGGAVGVWIPFALMSFAASFADQWLPLLVSVSALVGMLVVGSVVRAVRVHDEGSRIVPVASRSVGIRSRL